MALIALPCNNCLSKNCQWFSFSFLQGAKEEKSLKVPMVAEHLQQIPAVFCQWGQWKTSLMHFQSALTSAKTALHGKGFPALFFLQVSWEVHGLPSCLWEGILPTAHCWKDQATSEKISSKVACLERCSWGIAAIGNLHVLSKPGKLINNNSKDLLLSQLKGVPSLQSPKAATGFPHCLWASKQCLLTDPVAEDKTVRVPAVLNSPKVKRISCGSMKATLAKHSTWFLGSKTLISWT